MQTSEKSQKKSTNGDLIIFGALEAINLGINLNLDFGFNHTISGVDTESMTQDCGFKINHTSLEFGALVHPA